MIMREVNITELRNHLPVYLEQVHTGNEIWVTSRGHVIARLLPPPDAKTEAREQLKQLRKHCKVGDVVSPLNEDWNVDDDHS